MMVKYFLEIFFPLSNTDQELKKVAGCDGVEVLLIPQN
jgi:hypothetical protein